MRIPTGLIFFPTGAGSSLLSANSPRSWEEGSSSPKSPPLPSSERRTSSLLVDLQLSRYINDEERSYLEETTGHEDHSIGAGTTTSSFPDGARSEEYFSHAESSFHGSRSRRSSSSSSSFVDVARSPKKKENFWLPDPTITSLLAPEAANKDGDAPAPIVDALMLALTVLLKSGSTKLHVGQLVFKKAQCASSGESAEGDKEEPKGICDGAELLEIVEIVEEKKATVKSAHETGSLFATSAEKSSSVDTAPKTASPPSTTSVDHFAREEGVFSHVRPKIGVRLSCHTLLLLGQYTQSHRRCGLHNRWITSHSSTGR